MSERGRRRIASVEQCAEVQRLASEGLPVRAIAAQVFGDPRFRGRVERILRPSAPVAAEPELFPGGDLSVETVPTVRMALSRYLARVERGSVQPTVADLVKLLDLERRLQAFESIERLNARSRERDTAVVDEVSAATS